MSFAKKLIKWYHKNKRDLPWRNTDDAYKIWVSEIILQQTRVEQGKSYYLKFIEKYPDIRSLAEADEKELLKLWQGLGYYSRALNMHIAAKQISLMHHGELPESYDEIIKLRGIGKYTAAAILSFAYSQPYPVLDGNVKRVLARIYAVNSDISETGTEKIFYKKLDEILDKKNPSDFNQAIMEFGALHCVPVNPDCKICIFIKECKAFNSGKVDEIPLKKRKSKVKRRYFYYIVPFNNKNNITYTFLMQRGQNDIWKLLFQFPLIETTKPLSILELRKTYEFRKMTRGVKYKISEVSPAYIHKLSHQEIFAVFIQLHISGELHVDKLIKIKAKDLEDYPVPRLIEKYMKLHGFLRNKNFFEV
ncbi:MAG: A/G-specific adenine glycosylase [Bacteroidales bacterium]|jgi:A/G-specific adenine glycosylase|nr:A/G-specific adenine glycosylase [Bacteroidales bacterium]